ncbi:c-type cytochrome [Methyloraptor flagellatus]|uniref:C-type cytochrome n=1 Tax=Methyloraptor flagellatus TaxID=3162530 RepID=A0AAU7XB78_9HYPH
MHRLFASIALAVPAVTAAVLAVSVLELVAAEAAEVPDPANGLRLARRWCAACHVVEPSQTAAAADAPAFAALAADPLRAEDAIANILAAPAKAHSKMQDLALSRLEIGDLVAYIKSLRR